MESCFSRNRNSSRLSNLVAVVVFSVIVLQTLSGSLAYDGVSGHSGGWRSRNLLVSGGRSQRNTKNQIPNCIQMVSESQCSLNPNCRWCRSQSIDDMCFGKAEAWRLPQQVFSCN